MRVTQRDIYSTFIGNMGTSLDKLMDLNQQSASQKKVNRPSDDPVGAARILGYRSTLTTISRYQSNISTATGWLKLADDTMSQVSTVLTRAKELASQASTGTMTAQNREQISYEARQLMSQLVSLSNTTYEGESIFAGHKTDGPAFKDQLWMDSNDPALSASQFSISGSSDKTLMVRYSVSGGPTDTLGSGNVSYEYSDDGGKTFKAAQAIPASGGNVVLTLGGVSLTLDGSKSVTAYDPAKPTSTATGTWSWIRPTAQYLGDDKDQSGTVVDAIGSPAVTGSFSGSPGRNVLVRIDAATAFNAPIQYSYSLDNGSNWTSGNTFNDSSATTSVGLVVPGGVLTLNSVANPGVLNPGDEFSIRPRDADINLEISAGQRVAINNVGKDVFGGVYQNPGSTSASAVFGGAAKNVFETMGKLVSALETNNQQGVQQSLTDLKDAAQNVLTAQATVGGRENRLTIANSVLSNLQDNDKARMSTIEDADLTELMTKLANQQLAYQAVLKSSASVMQMSLMSYMG